MEKWELAYQDYLNKMKYKDIAEKYDVSINTVKSWKSRKWNAPPEKKVAHKTKKVAHKKEAPPEILNDGTEDITDVLEYYGITEQQRRFADNYIESANIFQSAIKAGYSESFANSLGYKLLGYIGIKSYIDDRMRVLSSNKVANQEEILTGLTRIFNRQEEEHTVVTLRSKKEEWVPTGEDGALKKMVVETEEPKVVAFPGKISDAVKAADLLLKRLDLSKKQGTDTNITIVDAWSDLDDD